MIPVAKNPLLTKKTPRASLGVFFCACLLLLGALLAPHALADCVLGEADELVALKKVVDGDTLRLKDGRRVRLIGVNTPELAHGQRRAQPLAEEAKEFTERFLAGGDLELVYDKDRYDNHGRVLAHVYNHRGDSLESALLSAGLAFHIAIAPNLTLAECLASREDEAHQRGLGVWAPGVWPVLAADQVSPGDGGFVLLSGTVQKTDRNRYLWLELDGPVAVRLDPKRDYGHRNGRNWQGRKIVVKGWLVDRGGKYSSRNKKHKRWFIASDSEFTIEISRD
ncbi:thermonuclease family protein [Microbulbifer hydrolyticus]|uniref:Endonuclease YncB(Thermonuclease family) n=1 Tax=Microbulbifer hydrolyticus TaxID=48074 RepID=A0A6P1T8Q0_9GAMM|nr:thermonuclease family protein [Microbulbifer hydrolyticus]MBB5211626.1 endonuclease YncB(thermonuclease family) [Microbulbifer hydrolyticus]QHQ37639.1 thermonuclease family protein [Microbulbifer hydrolyticus]